VPCWRYEKFRTCFQKPDEPGEIVYDETPVGDYLELEGPSRWIDRTARRLGFGLRDYLTASYRDLFVAHVEGKKNASGDMLFGRRGMRRTPRSSR
jgi:adenylate cyclase class 2